VCVCGAVVCVWGACVSVCGFIVCVCVCVCAHVSSSMFQHAPARSSDVVPRIVFKRLCQLLPREYPCCASEPLNAVADAM
jgi:hypothetical protein